MAPMTSAERQRKYREKLKKEEPDKFEKLKKENAERTKKNYKKIHQLPEDLQKITRKRWQQQKQKEKNTKKDEPKPNAAKDQKEKRKARYLLNKKNLLLHNTVKRLTRIVQTQKQAIRRYKQKILNLTLLLNNTENRDEEIKGLENKEATTPFSKTESFIQETIPNIPSADKKKVKRAIFEANVLKESLSNQYSETKTKSEKAVLRNVVDNDIVKKYKIKTELGSSWLGLKGRIRQRQRTLEIKRLRRVKEIETFLKRDDNSRVTAGKNETKTHKKEKKQVRYLLDSLEKLHKKYKAEGGLASYTTFTRYRPFYILDPKLTQRNTCACVKHANLKFLAQKLKILGVLQTDDLDQLVSMITCDKFNDTCMYNECKTCENVTVSFDLTHVNKDSIVWWNAWVTKSHEYTKSNNNQENITKVTKRTTKDLINGTLETLIKTFSDQLLKFKKHYFNVHHAYQMYQKCKQTLPDNECIIHCDFSENYLCKSNEEVQATHFGASKQQFTLHTGVMYYKHEQTLQEKSFCTISPNNNHGPIAIWAHLTPILDYIRKTLTNVKTVNFFSDGPTTQYRQKGNFYMMSKMVKKLGFQNSTWTFFESAHGKGAADGIGGAVKRTLDKKVTYGEDIVNAQIAYDILQKCQSKIMYFYISDDNVNALEQDFDLTGLVPVPQTMNIHQIITTDQVDVIKFRKIACFCREILCECFGLQEHNLTLKKQKRKHDEDKKEITKNTTKRRRTQKSRKRPVRPDDSDTSIDSNITFADSDVSIYNPDNENEDDWNDNENIIKDALEESRTMSDKTEKSFKCNAKKITVLSEIRNTPDNTIYFDLKNYGPLSLNEVDKIEKRESNITYNDLTESCVKETKDEIEISTAIKRDDVAREVEIVQKRTVLEEEEVIHEKKKELEVNATEKIQIVIDEIEISTAIKRDDVAREIAIVQKRTVLEEEEVIHEKKKELEVNATEKIQIVIDEIEISTAIKRDDVAREIAIVQKRTVLEEEEVIHEKKKELEVNATEKIKNVIEERNYDKKEIAVEEPINAQEETKCGIYKIDDSVLVRYYEKKAWVYYVGFIEGVEVKADSTYYTIKFLKTVKKPELKFKVTKKIDKDTVPAQCVVKIINLNIVSNDFFLCDSCDYVFFE